MRVLIRADASPAIGSGHVARCLTLAHALRDSGAEVVFACRALPGNSLARLEGEGFRAVVLPAQYAGENPQLGIEALLPWQADIEALNVGLALEPLFDWIVVDHYGLDHRWQTAARQWARHIAAIDDLNNRKHAVDVLFDQNLTAGDPAYAQRSLNPCRQLFGPRYALIRDEFRRAPLPQRTRPSRVLVNFGGFDSAGETWKAMRALADFSELEVDFIAGTANPALAQMQVMAAQRPQWRLQTYVSDFASLMAQADLFIGAGGGTSWERAVLGLPTICIAVAGNQQANAERLAAAGGHVYLGTSDEVDVECLRQAAGFLLSNVSLRRSLAKQSRCLVDGLGARRFAAALAGSSLRVRRATIEDSRLLFDGRNAETVRRWSANAERIDWETHQAWLAASLTNPRRLLLIAEFVDGPVGMLRYDLDGARAEVSVYLFEGRFGLGWGRALLARGEDAVIGYWPELTAVEARVLPGNQASLKLFRDSGYVQSSCHFERVLKDQLHD
ncbi:UDP-2,4-diacetamido-2,4,6-trideoxy-beta-L-altropyranose hydrolase [Pseudomonas sp. PD9R]|uniref:UDP-2,4-diacetamido-2,4, 6-trideoxy-beta-L-altropyranose hydrolase n=1 Tax=Pseudomonas sp. PD9R TaxID=2853534 RepID=UPI001C46EBC8|nr:UDP-2,4-diacetamido-2,4,6-trideoxy-beta-L-altropyranose hydrolase [Pseudomonas sp. PD9R]MBV6823724.1 UDP-2,4-diacetamido-2,4,6-trideoxy-beta-L-altropyranose hydrolase [Pseudomonas sp. PD9R]